MLTCRQHWTQLGNKVTEATIALNVVEKEVFDMLRLEVSHLTQEQNLIYLVFR